MKPFSLVGTCNTLGQSKVDKEATLLICTRKIPGSNLDQDIDHPDRGSRVLRYLQINSGIVP
jgi:hypothetical protein